MKWEYKPRFAILVALHLTAPWPGDPLYDGAFCGKRDAGHG
jgi:hypothetical protein